MAGRRRRTKHQQMKEQYNLLHRLPRPLSPRPSEPTLLPTTLPSLIQYNMATSCVAGQTLPASLPACQPAVPVRRRCCLPSLQCAHTLKAPCPPGHSLIPVYPTTRSHLPPLQQTKVLPKLHLPYSLLELLFYYHPVLIRLQAASCLPEVQDSRPLPPSTQLSPVHVPTRWPAYTCLHLPTPTCLHQPGRSHTCHQPCARPPFAPELTNSTLGHPYAGSFPSHAWLHLLNQATNLPTLSLLPSCAMACSEKYTERLIGVNILYLKRLTISL